MRISTMTTEEAYVLAESYASDYMQTRSENKLLKNHREELIAWNAARAGYLSAIFQLQEIEYQEPLNTEGGSGI